MEQRKISFPTWPFFEQDEIDAVVAVLKSGKVNYWTGEEGKNFEKEYADYTGTRYSVALSNGTIALELALKAAGIGEEDEVVVAPRTFIATASAVALRGARPVFADVDRERGNITAETIRPVLTSRTRAIIPVHLGGWPCDMDPIMELARENGLVVIEDCAQAHGAEYHGRRVGSIGDMGAFSFCQDKIITTGGEGGMITTDNEEYWNLIWSLKDHGKSYQAVFNREHPPGFRWLHESFGTNARMTEMQAAIGRRALSKLPRWLEIRRRNAEIYTRHLSGLSAVHIPTPSVDIKHAWYRFYLYVIPERLKSDWSRDRIMNEIGKLGRPGLSGTCCEIYLEKAFSAMDLCPVDRLPNARWLTENSLMLPVHPALSSGDIEDIAETVARVIEEASGV
jgi:dTDP-4-amino-4,6-dideoxygalactose transaminase